MLRPIKHQDSLDDKHDKRLVYGNAAAASLSMRRLDMVMCQDDPIHWCNNWCWIFDPRFKTQRIPFVLKPYQEDIFRSLLEEENRNQIVVKSRDMGATYTYLAFFVWEILFKENVESLVVSQKREKVDDWTCGSLIGKVEYMLQNTPSFMFPHGPFERKFLMVTNGNGSLIKGEAASDDLGRGGRYKRILWDECASAERSSAKYSSLVAATKNLNLVSTPKGKQGIFSYIHFDDTVDIIRHNLHWSNDKDKDAEWYEKEKRKIGDPVVVAQELDCDFTASIEGRIYTMLSIEKHIVDWEVQSDTEKIRMWDYGMSSDPTVCLWAEIFYNEDNEKCIYIYQEHDDRDQKQSPEWHARQVVYNTPHYISREWGDPAGQNRDASMVSYIDQLSNHSVNVCKEIQKKNTGREVKIYSQGINISSTRMEVGYGIMLVRIALEKNRLFISEKCTHLIECVSNYRQKVSKGQVVQRDSALELFNPLHDWTSHKCDALRYGIQNELFDLVETKYTSGVDYTQEEYKMVTAGMRHGNVGQIVDDI